MSTATEQDKNEHAKANAAGWLESIREMVDDLRETVTHMLRDQSIEG